MKGGLARTLARPLGAVLAVVLAWIAVGGAVSAPGAPKPRGEFFDIGGRRLRMVCEGPREAPGPTVILESGAFGFSADWAAVQARLAAEGVRSCAYDRAGMGYSDPGPDPRDGVAAAQDLEALLKASGEAGPYVLVGHSMAGLRIWLFARRNPEKTAGLVLVDASTPEVSASPSMKPFLEQFTRISKFAGWASAAGLMKPLSFMGDSIGLPPAAAAEKRWVFGRAGHNHAGAQEVIHWEVAARQAAAAGPLDPELPVAVITAGQRPPGMRSGQTAPALASRRGHVANDPTANHASLLGLKHCGAIVEAIDFVRAAARERGA